MTVAGNADRLRADSAGSVGRHRRCRDGEPDVDSFSWVRRSVVPAPSRRSRGRRAGRPPTDHGRTRRMTSTDSVTPTSNPSSLGKSVIVMMGVAGRRRVGLGVDDQEFISTGPTLPTRFLSRRVRVNGMTRSPSRLAWGCHSRPQSGCHLTASTWSPSPCARLRSRRQPLKRLCRTAEASGLLDQVCLRS